MTQKEQYIPFSQRTGLNPPPPQLKLGEVSADLRRLIDYSFAKEFGRNQYSGYGDSHFSDDWEEVATDFHVRFLKQPFHTFKNRSNPIKLILQRFIDRSEYGQLFDFLEFFSRHPKCSDKFKTDLASAFVEARAAYRFVDSQIVAVGTQEAAEAFEAAIAASEITSANSVRKHLVNSGSELRNGNWANSVRESIHAVEAMARRIAPHTNTLGPALKKLENTGYIHGSLKSAFEKLYGYTNDEGGIRHALLEDEARVDEVDALFMLGTCASFVSYLIARQATTEWTDQD